MSFTKLGTVDGVQYFEVPIIEVLVNKDGQDHYFKTYKEAKEFSKNMVDPKIWLTEARVKKEILNRK